VIKRVKTNNKLIKKSYEIYYDPTSEKFVLHIGDFDGLLPLLIKGDKLERVYNLEFTRNRKLRICCVCFK
jgi:hypothetical protein